MLAEPAADGEGVAFHRGVAPLSAGQHEGLVRRRDPVQYVVCGPVRLEAGARHPELEDRKSTRLNSSHVAISYAVFCLKKKKERENEEMRGHNLNICRCEVIRRETAIE